MYNVSRNGKEIGQYPKEEIVDGLMTRFFLPTDHCWKPGMTEWKLLVVEFDPPVDPTLPPPPPLPASASERGRPTEGTHQTPSAPSVEPQAVPNITPAGRIAWLAGGFFMPYFFAWRIIFDRTYGFTKRTKIIYSVWLACFFLSLVNASIRGAFASHGGSRQTESQESKNAAFLATLTPEQREAMKSLQASMRSALREHFDYQDTNKDGKLDMKEFLGKGLLDHSNSEDDFRRKDINNDGFLTFEEAFK